LEGELQAAPERLRPLLALARKLTLDQTKVSRGDIRGGACVRLGRTGRARRHQCALFNFMNRYVHGH
jgi:hypothetical protein